MGLSILIVTFNRPDDLLDLFESLRAQEEHATLLEEVLVLDNGTTVDYSEPWAFARQNDELGIRVIRSEKNLGVTGGRNMFMSEARGDVLLVLDDDVVLPTARDLVGLAEVFDKEIFRAANAAVVQLRVVYHETKELQRSTFPHKRRSSDEQFTEFLTSYFTGGAHLIKKESLDVVGIYPEDFFYGMGRSTHQLPADRGRLRDWVHTQCHSRTQRITDGQTRRSRKAAAPVGEQNSRRVAILAAPVCAHDRTDVEC